MPALRKAQRFAGAAAVFAASLSVATPLAAEDAAAEIRQALAQWTEDFNAGRTDKVCDLFAADVRADIRGAAERDHAAICALLVSSLKDGSKHYHYAMDIKEILVFGDVAVVRLVWTLIITLANGASVQSIEPGMDISRSKPTAAGRSSATWPMRASDAACQAVLLSVFAAISTLGCEAGGIKVSSIMPSTTATRAACSLPPSFFTAS
jgi:ketosteroid isomerase-like protein